MSCNCGCKNGSIKSYVSADMIDNSPYSDAVSLLALDKCGNLITVNAKDILAYDNDGNVVLKRKTKILATHPDNSTHELIGINEYTIEGELYLQSEIGDPAVHLNFNTNNDPTFGVNPSVDTPLGKRIIEVTEP